MRAMTLTTGSVQNAPAPHSWFLHAHGRQWPTRYQDRAASLTSAMRLPPAQTTHVAARPRASLLHFAALMQKRLQPELHVDAIHQTDVQQSSLRAGLQEWNHRQPRRTRQPLHPQRTSQESWTTPRVN